eukprot:1770966-Prymnesium_polylepis.1
MMSACFVSGEGARNLRSCAKADSLTPAHPLLILISENRSWTSDAQSLTAAVTRASPVPSMPWVLVWIAEAKGATYTAMLVAKTVGNAPIRFRN